MTQSSDFFQRILDSLNSSIKIVDSNGIIRFANQAARDFVNGSDLNDVAVDDPRFGEEGSIGKVLLDRILTGESPKTVEIRQKNPDGVKHYFELQAEAIHENGEPFVALILRDITDQKLIDQELLQRERLASIGQVASSFAHEIKNPLTGIRLGLSLLKKELADSEIIESITHDVKRLDQILNQLLDFARVKDKQKDWADINQIVERAIFLMRQEAEQRQIELTVETSDILPRIKVDADKIQQVIVNLVLNAYQAIERDGRVSIKTTNYTRNEILGVMVAISDDGCGIPESDLYKINSLFYTTKPDGTGLGLPMSQKLIREHGGSIVFDSTEGHGTTVSVFLPVEID